MRGHYGKHRQVAAIQREIQQHVDFWGAPAPYVGAVVHHVGEFDPALQKLDTEFAVLLREFCAHIGVAPDDLVFTAKRVAEITQDPVGWAKKQHDAFAKLEASPLFPFWDSYLKPLINEWHAFLDDPFTTADAVAPSLGWEKIEKWQDRLLKARAAVNETFAKHGKPALESPDPAPLPKSAVERAGDAAGDVAGGAKDLIATLLGGMKWAVIGILGLAGAAAVASIVHNVRENKDPVREYAGLARRSR